MSLTEDQANIFMEEVFYQWWEETLSLFSDARRAEFETNTEQFLHYEELMRSAFMAGVKSERKRIHRKSMR